MPFTPFTIDASVTEIEGGVVRIPEGDYLFELTAVKPSPEDRTGDPFLSFHTKAVEGMDGGRGKTLRTTAMLSGDKQWTLGRTLNAFGADPSQFVGLSIQNYAAFQKLAQTIEKSLKGRRAGGEVVDGEYNGKIISNVAGWFPESDWDVRKPGGEGSTPAPEAAPAPAARGTRTRSAAKAPEPEVTTTEAPAAEAPAANGAAEEEDPIMAKLAAMFK